jgi:hypothetical protein
MLVTGLMMLSALTAHAVARNGPDGSGAAPSFARGSTPDNDSEPNNDFANATLITGNAVFGGVVGYGDIDYYKIMLNTAPTPGGNADTLDVTVTCDNVTRMSIYDPNQFLILQDPGPGSHLEYQFTAFLTGYYYIYLWNVGPCNYIISTTVGSAAFTSDNDNDPSSATAISPTAGNPYTTTGSLDNSSDMEDFYKVHLDFTPLVSTDVLKARVTSPATGAFVVQLYASGQNIPFTLHTPIMGQPDMLTFSPMASGDYYLQVWGPMGSGQYDLKVSKITGTADSNGELALATALGKSDLAGHWYNASDSLTLGIDPDDYWMVPNVVAGQVFNCTVNSTDYDATDRTPDININMYNDTDTLPPGNDTLANPGASANATMQSNGNFFVQLNLTEWGGAYDLSIFTNSPPVVASTVANISFPENSTNTTIKLAQVFSDPENDLLTYTYQLYGDNLPGNVTIGIGSDQDGTVTITPVSGWHGAFSMDLTATDTSGASVTTTVQQVWVYAINHKPMVIDPNPPDVIMTKNITDFRSLDLTTVFQDPDSGDRLWYNVTGNISLSVTFAKDPNNLFLHTGEVTIRPAQDFVGSEVLTFTATDGGFPALTSDPVSVTVQVREIIIEKLTVTEPPKLQLNEDAPATLVDLGLYVSSNLPNDTFTFAYIARTSSNLTVNLTPDGKAYITPQDEWSGTEVLSFTVSCSHGISGNLSLTVQIYAVNELPVFDSWTPATFNITIDETETVPFRINVSDEETPQSQLKMRWTLNGANVTGATEYTLFTDYNTVLTSEGSKLFIVRVTVNDTAAVISMAWNVTVNNVNRRPTDVVISFPPENSTFDEGAKVHFIGVGSDPDGDTVVFQWYEGTKLLGSGKEFNYTKLKAGKHTITLKVSDATSSGTATIIVKVNAKKSPGFEGAAAVAALAIALVAVSLLGRRRRN